MNTIIKSLLYTLIIFAGLPSSYGQTFLKQGSIEYEMTVNVQKNLSSDFWGEIMADKRPQFSISYWTLNFSNDKSRYQFEKWGGSKLPSYMTQGTDDKFYYYDFTNNTFQKQTINFGSQFQVAGDSIPTLNWKLVNENREIAGFNCRKAYAVLFDSVYVFAFYTEEILLPGGPQSFNGLPGTILGITIPRLYTSIIATKVEVNDIPSIKPAKFKKPISPKDYKNIFDQRLLKDWSSEDPEEKTYTQKLYWDALM